MIPDAQIARETVSRLIEISIYVGVIYLAILLFRRIFGKKMSPALRYAIWFLLLIRLSVPVTVQTGWHLIVLPEEKPVAVMAAEPAEARQDASPVPYRPDTAARPTQGTGTAEAAESMEAGQTPVRTSIWQILFWVWIAGIAVMLARQERIRILLFRRLKTTASLPDGKLSRSFRMLAEKMGIRAKLRMLCVSDISSPALTIGLWPEVLLPESLTGPGQKQNRTFALRHELMHFKRKDHLVMIWMGLLKAIWWFHPAVWLMEKPIRMDMESACDAMAVEGLSEQGKLAYASLLLELGKESVL